MPRTILNRRKTLASHSVVFGSNSALALVTPICAVYDVLAGSCVKLRLSANVARFRSYAFCSAAVRNIARSLTT